MTRVRKLRNGSYTRMPMEEIPEMYQKAIGISVLGHVRGLTDCGLIVDVTRHFGPDTKVYVPSPNDDGQNFMGRSVKVRIDDYVRPRRLRGVIL